MKIVSIIFDLNGTVLVDEDVYKQAFVRVLSELGVKVEDNFRHTRGIGVKENWLRLLSKYNLKTTQTIDSLVQETQKKYLEMFDKVALRRGFKDFVLEIKQAGKLTGLATSNSWSVVEKVFDKFSIKDFFDCVTTCEEVSVNKPSPEIFLITADKLFTAPENCLVFEDAPSGIEAAQAAGMKAVAMAGEGEVLPGLGKAEFICNDFSKVSMKKFIREKS